MNAKELINLINLKETGASKPIEGDPDALLFSNKTSKGVIIRLDAYFPIDESFNEVKLKCLGFSTSKDNKVEEFFGLYLYTEAATLTMQHGSLFLDFIDIENRKLIQEDPFKWYSLWKEAIGNSVKNKMIYDIIGELETLLILQKQDKKPLWDSTSMSSFDISTSDFLYEVKSTISKYITQAVIHSKYQAKTSNLGVPLYLVFVRLEQNQTGECIDSLVQKLVHYGYDKNALEDYLNKKGYGEGKEERYSTYNILELRKYLIDDTFPRITNESFKNNELPLGITNIEYTVSLDGLPYENIEKE